MLIPHRFYIKLNKEYPYEYLENSELRKPPPGSHTINGLALNCEQLRLHSFTTREEAAGYGKVDLKKWLMATISEGRKGEMPILLKAT